MFSPFVQQSVTLIGRFGITISTMLAREVGLENMWRFKVLTVFYDINRAQFASLLLNTGPNFVDTRGKLLPRAFDLLGLYATFIFQKPDPDLEPLLTTPIPFEGSNNHDERDLPVITDTSAAPEDSSQGLGRISEQKGILGPGAADLRFTEAI